MEEKYYVYILASKRNETLYTGITSDLVKRVYQHKQGFVEGFTKKYDVYIVVYYEQLKSANEAIAREKKLKKWKRAWKIVLIESLNPEWNDLYLTIL